MELGFPLGVSLGTPVSIGIGIAGAIVGRTDIGCPLGGIKIGCALPGCCVGAPPIGGAAG